MTGWHYRFAKRNSCLFKKQKAPDSNSFPDFPIRKYLEKRFGRHLWSLHLLNNLYQQHIAAEDILHQSPWNIQGRTMVYFSTRPTTPLSTSSPTRHRSRPFQPMTKPSKKTVRPCMDAPPAQVCRSETHLNFVAPVLRFFGRCIVRFHQHLLGAHSGSLDIASSYSLRNQFLDHHLRATQ